MSTENPERSTAIALTDSLVASDKGLPVGTGCRVTLHFSLLLPSGEEIDTTRNNKPAEFEVGDDNLPAGFEESLMGRRPGYAGQISLTAEKAFGERNEGNIRIIAKEKFAQLDDCLEPGLMVFFQAPGGELPGVIMEVYENSLRVDFNHPLSGRTIIFDVEILKVERVNR